MTWLGTGKNHILHHKSDHTFEDEGVARGLPDGTGFSHDVECHDWFDADGILGGDGFPELVIARRESTKNLLYLNDGAGNFIDRSDLFADVDDTTQEVEVCDLDPDGVPEILFGNGNVLEFERFENRVLTWDGAQGQFVDSAADFGFDFDAFLDLTEDIKCGDLGGDGTLDVVLIGNTRETNRLFRRN